MTKQIIQPAGLPKAASYAYSQGVRAGNTLYLAGQASVDRNNNVVHENDFEAQTRLTFTNIEAVLKEAGGTLADLVTMTVFITDMRNAADFLRLRGEILQRDFPASALIGISQLAVQGLLLEVQSVAVLG